MYSYAQLLQIFSNQVERFIFLTFIFFLTSIFYIFTFPFLGLFFQSYFTFSVNSISRTSFTELIFHPIPNSIFLLAFLDDSLYPFSHSLLSSFATLFTFHSKTSSFPPLLLTPQRYSTWGYSLIYIYERGR